MGFFGPRQGKQLRSTQRHLATGSELGVATLIGALGGWWIDRRFGTQPWFLIFGLLIGVAAGFKNLLRLRPPNTKKPPPPP